MPIPHLIKYMGSKRNLIDFVIQSINQVMEPKDSRLYDLFGGTAVVSAAFRNIIPVTCNDIQIYTSVLAKTYLENKEWNQFPEDFIQKTINEISSRIEEKINTYGFKFSYDQGINFNQFLELEKNQKLLIEENFNDEFHLFTKYYSGTYLSYNQCIEIDSIISILHSERIKNSFLFNLCLSSLMFAMAYTTIGTGHYAQYREPEEGNMEDILIYRTRKVLPLFQKKLNELIEYFNQIGATEFQHNYTTNDYLEILDNLEENAIVYADPPYQFVHYSRFYHLIETLVRYDYPEIGHKGRYRKDRHQSPFCQKSNVEKAFIEMFERINNRRAKLLLSYSNNGMISLERIIELGNQQLREYQINVETLDYLHKTMGRRDDSHREVEELIITMIPN